MQSQGKLLNTCFESGVARSRLADHDRPGSGTGGGIADMPCHGLKGFNFVSEDNSCS